LVLKKLLQFFLFSNLFIAGAAVIMGWQTLDLYTGEKQFSVYYEFLFFATLTSYNAHWYLSALVPGNSVRATWLQKYRILHGWFFFLGLAGTSWFGWQLRDHWFWLAVAGVPTFLYTAPKIPYPLFNWLKKIAVGKTFFLSAVWTYATALLPLQIAAVNWYPSTWLFLAGRFLLLYGICILFDYRDREEDKKDGILTLLHVFDDKQVRWFFYTSMVIFFAVNCWQFNYLSAVETYSLLLPGLLLTAVFGYARKNFSDYLYYLFLDGLMMLSGLVQLLWKMTN
jgi:UbiA prenyltransferase family